MSDLAQSFIEGGFMMYPIVLSGLFLVVLGLGLLTATLVTRKLALTFAAVMLIGAGVPAMLGLAGYSMGMSGSRAAVVHAAPEDREIILMASEGEALNCTTWGYGFAVVPTLMGFALLGLGLSRLDRLKPAN
jgi:hypothetical protein